MLSRRRRVGLFLSAVSFLNHNIFIMMDNVPLFTVFMLFRLCPVEYADLGIYEFQNPPIANVFKTDYIQQARYGRPGVRFSYFPSDGTLYYDVFGD
jgi:hypothetical protein